MNRALGTQETKTKGLPCLVAELFKDNKDGEGKK